MVGSEFEYECLAVGLWRFRFGEPGLDCAIVRRLESGVEGKVVVSLSFGVGGHRGFRVSKIGLEMSRLSTEDVREVRDEGAFFPLRLSVSLVHEKARLGLVLDAGVFFPGEHGGVTSPIGTR